MDEMIAQKNSSRHWFNRLLFYSAKLPGIYFLIIAGVVIDFMIQLPFAIICSLENRFLRRSQ